MYGLLALYIAVSLGYYGAGVIAAVQQWFYPNNYARAPFDVDEDRGVIASVEDEAKKAGIRVGDRLEALNDSRFSGEYQLLTNVRNSRPGATLRVTIRHANAHTETVSVRLAARKGPPWSAGTVALFATLLFVPLLCLLVGYWVVAARPRDWNAWFVLVALSFAEAFFSNLDWTWWPNPWFALFGSWATALQTLVYSALLLLGIYFPERWRADVRWPWLKWLIVMPQLVGFPLILFDNWLQWFHVSAAYGAALDSWSSWIFRILGPVSVVLFWVALIDKLRSASTADARRRLRLLVVGAVLSQGPLLLGFLLGHFGIHSDILADAFIPAFVIFPLTLAYVLVVQRAMDLRILVRMGTKYTLARGFVWLLRAGVIALLIILFSVPTHHLVDTEARIAAVIALIVLLRFRAFRHLSNWVDRKFFREAYNTEHVLTELSDQVRLFTDRDALIETVTRRISDVLHVPEIAVWLRGSDTLHLLGTPAAMALSDGSATVQTVERTNHPITLYREDPDQWLLEAPIEERRALDQVNAEVLLGLPGRDRLMGIVALGPKQSEEPYTSSDL
ncbi:MAG: PDZ domain-containing protein, partial [Bryobacteraceae bacterium]